MHFNASIYSFINHFRQEFATNFMQELEIQPLQHSGNRRIIKVRFKQLRNFCRNFLILVDNDEIPSSRFIVDESNFDPFLYLNTKCSKKFTQYKDYHCGARFKKFAMARLHDSRKILKLRQR